jgi:serine/threonine protein kinase/tetratricopeptide (TPR) repeat protein
MSQPRENGMDNTRSYVPISKGTMVSHYRIIEKIGSGGMGDVYLAEDTRLNRKVALKFLPPHLCQDEDCRSRFKREAQAAAKLNHPNIVTIHEVGEHRGRPYLAMEHVEGQSLRDIVAGKDLSIDRILELGIQVCEGLIEAHEKGVTHRDIKPSNILVDSHGRARIVDFGLASIVGTDQLTKTGSTLGTIGYMSPEQVQGREINHRSDLFSLGVIIYELISKQNPFKRDSEAATLKAVCDDLPEPLARFKSGLPDGVQAIIDKALEKDVKTRYQHADGMLSDLMRIKQSLDTGQRTVSAITPVRRSKPVWRAAAALLALTVAVALIVTKPWITDSVPDDDAKIRLVVLPFENLGGPEDEYFAGGITDAITSHLAKIGGLSVISRTSAKKYRATQKTLTQIGQELNVSYVLEGTILWDKSGDTDRVRIIPQLIQVSDDSHVWAEEYEHDLTQIFAVQADIATSIAEKLNIKLLEPEREALAEIPTESTEAYQAYLLAGEQETDSLKVLMYERAISLDPSFALAYSSLSWHHSTMYQLNVDRSEERLQRAKRAVDSALALQPDLPNAHLSLGFYYYCAYRDYDKASKEYATARKGLPNSPSIPRVEGWILRRQGRFEEAVNNFTKAFQLNPRSDHDAYEIAYTHLCLRNYEEALIHIDKAISLEPGSEWYYTIKTLTLIVMGDPQSARRLLSNLPSPERAWLMWTYLEMFEGNYDAALEHLSIPQRELFNAGTWMWSVNVLRGIIYQRMEKNELAQTAFDSARAFMESHEDEYAEYIGYQAVLAMAYAGLGQKEKAIRLGRLELEKYPFSRDVLDAARAEQGLAYVYVMTGEYDAAIDLLEHVMSVPFDLESVATLRNFPWWDPLRDHPRFQALIEKCEKEHGV